MFTNNDVIIFFDFLSLNQAIYYNLYLHYARTITISSKNFLPYPFKQGLLSNKIKKEETNFRRKNYSCVIHYNENADLYLLMLPYSWNQYLVKIKPLSHFDLITISQHFAFIFACFKPFHSFLPLLFLFFTFQVIFLIFITPFIFLLLLFSNVLRLLHRQEPIFYFPIRFIL